MPSKQKTALVSLANADVNLPFRPSDIENMDRAMFEWLETQIKSFSKTFKDWKQIPVLWVSAERSVQIKDDKGLRDDDGALILPIITLSRTGMEKDLKRKGVVQAHLPEVNGYQGGVAGYITVAKKVNTRKTGDFANASSNRTYSGGSPAVNFNTRGRRTNKVVYDIYTMPTPVYVMGKYEVSIRTGYQEQMNELLTPLMVYTGGVNQFVLRREGHLYEGFIEQAVTFDNSVGKLGEDERQYNSTLPINVFGYLLGQGNNRAKPQFARRQNIVEVRLPRERVMVGDIPDFLDRSFFRGGEITPTHQAVEVEPTRVEPIPLMPSPRGTGGGGGGDIVVQDEGANITTAVQKFDFTGAGVTATAAANVVTVNIDASSIVAKEEGDNITTAMSSIDFAGSAVTATAVGTDVTVTIDALSAISSSDEGVEIASSVDSFDFVGAGITATAVGSAVTVTVPATAITAKEEGVNLTTGMTSIDFAGPNVVATNVGDAVTITVTGSYIEAQDEGSSLTSNITSVDFVGAGVTATNSAGAVTVTITGSTGGVPVNTAIVNNTTYSEVPTGDVDGVNTVYTTSQDFINGSEFLFHNGLLMRKGALFDYTRTAADEITFTGAPLTGDFILISYVNESAS
jgi:hypothetical protein